MFHPGFITVQQISHVADVLVTKRDFIYRQWSLVRDSTCSQTMDTPCSVVQDVSSSGADVWTVALQPPTQLPKHQLIWTELCARQTWCWPFISWQAPMICLQCWLCTRQIAFVAGCQIHAAVRRRNFSQCKFWTVFCNIKNSSVYFWTWQLHRKYTSWTLLMKLQWHSEFHRPNVLYVLQVYEERKMVPVTAAASSLYCIYISRTFRGPKKHLRGPEQINRFGKMMGRLMPENKILITTFFKKSTKMNLYYFVVNLVRTVFANKFKISIQRVYIDTSNELHWMISFIFDSGDFVCKVSLSCVTTREINHTELHI